MAAAGTQNGRPRRLSAPTSCSASNPPPSPIAAIRCSSRPAKQPSASPLVNAQHPHNLIMGLGLKYAYTLGANTTLELYAAPVGDPLSAPYRLPPSRFRLWNSHKLRSPTTGRIPPTSPTTSSRRASPGAASNSKPAVSTAPNPARIAGSSRPAAIDSWSARLWYFPTKRWAAQFSAGRLARPEALEPGDQIRLTGIAPVLETNTGRNLVIQSHLGQESQHRDTPQSQRLSRGMGAAHPHPKLHHRPYRTRRQRRTLRRRPRPERNHRRALRKHLPHRRIHPRLHARLPNLSPHRRQASVPTSKPIRSPLQSSHTTATAPLAETYSYESDLKDEVDHETTLTHPDSAPLCSARRPRPKPLPA